MKVIAKNSIELKSEVYIIYADLHILYLLLTRMGYGWRAFLPHYIFACFIKKITDWKLVIF